MQFPAQLFTLSALSLSTSAFAGAAAPVPQEIPPHNVVIVLADDLGIDPRRVRTWRGGGSLARAPR